MKKLLVILFIAGVALFLGSDTARASWNPIPSDWNECSPTVFNEVYVLEPEDDPVDLFQLMYQQDPDAYNSLRTAPTYVIWEDQNSGVGVGWSTNANNTELYRTQTSPNRYNMRYQWDTASPTNEHWSWSASNYLMPDDKVQLDEPNQYFSNNVESRFDMYSDFRVCYAKNLTFASTIPLEFQLPTTEREIQAQNPTKGCSALDIPCWITKTYDGVVDSFGAMTESLLAGITYLFVPDGQIAQITFDELQDFLKDKLGFLIYPITYLVDLFTSLATITQDSMDWGTSICAVNPPSLPGVTGSNFLGANVSLDLCAMPQIAITAMRVIFQGSISLALIHMFRRKLHEVMAK